MNKLVFISGVHGVGKSTLCGKINDALYIKVKSCSDIIKDNSVYIENSKVVDKAEANQNALIFGLTEFRNNPLLLDGHFCLIGQNEEIIELDFKIFDQISPTLIINITASAKVIYRRMMERDGSTFPLSLIDDLQIQETKNSHEFGKLRGIPVVNYESGSDVSKLVNIIK